MKFHANWSDPKKIKEGNKFIYIRDWLVPFAYRNDFFEYWRRNRESLSKKGYSVYKKDNDWFMRESKKSLKDFKVAAKKEEDTPIVPHTVKHKNGLREWQIDAVGKIVASIKKWGCGVDGSDVGVGKTYTGCAVVRELKCKVLVVCPKAVKESWKRVISNHFNLDDKCVGIINYEMLRIGKSDSDIVRLIKNKKTRKKEYIWKIPKNTLIIWDEAQKLKNYKTKNSEVCMSAFKAGYKMLFCSATIATNPLELRTIGQCIKLFKNSRQFYTWAYEHGVFRGTFGMEFSGDKRALNKLHKDIFLNRGVRLNRDTIPNFPESQIIAQCYDMDKTDTAKIEKIYDDLKLELSKLDKKSKKDKASQLTEILRAREKIELLKIPLLVEMAQEGIENGMSIVIFCNFTQTVNALAERLNTKCIVNGEVKDKDRQKNIDNFQADKERVILINVAAGGAGISLHDITGKHPRLALISPSYSAVLMRQATGRVWRDAAKTKSVQKIVFVANTVEESVCKSVNQKLENLDLLNDGDLANI
jgi:superfamily II DNA or RNA helicase